MRTRDELMRQAEEEGWGDSAKAILIFMLDIRDLLTPQP